MSMYLIVTLAFADSAEVVQMSADEAEIKRLRQEMNRFQESGSLQYSEKLYVQMLEIDSELEWMTDSDHYAGAMAANAKGDLAQTLLRLERCQSSQRAEQWRSFLLAETSPVRIQSQPEGELTIMMGLLNPDQIAALDFANQRLQSNKTFIGRLPNGAYQYGTQQFLVHSSGMTMTSTTSEQSQIEEQRDRVIIPLNPFEGGALDVRLGGSVGAAMLRLGEGQVVETGMTLEPRSLTAVDIKPSIRLATNALFTQLELGYRSASNADSSLKSFVPGLVVGTEVRNFQVAFRSGGDFARLSFDEIGYIKRSVGYTYGLRGGYCPITGLCAEAQIDNGVLGSHSLFGVSLAISYQVVM